MEYPHWLMIAEAVLVAFGFVGFAFSQNKNKGGSRATTLFIVWPIGMLRMLLLQRGKPKR
jgi:hypothetical protein